MKNDLIKQLKKSRKRLFKAIKLYPEKPEGEWNRKELLSHIAGWDEEDVREVSNTSKILNGGKPISFTMTIDSYNKKSVAKRRNKNEKEILQEINQSHHQFIKMIKKLTENQISNYYGTIFRGKPINVIWIINETIHHDNGHAKEIEEKYG